MTRVWEWPSTDRQAAAVAKMEVVCPQGISGPDLAHIELPRAVGRSAKKDDISDVEGRENQRSKASEKARGDPEPGRRGGYGGEKDTRCAVLCSRERRCPLCGKVVGLGCGCELCPWSPLLLLHEE